MPRILMTGAAGGIGTSLRKLLPPIYPDLLLSDLKPPADLGGNEIFKAADLADLAQVEAICDGVDGILHFGGYSVEGPWDAIHQSNIIGCYNLFEAARKKGVKRVVFASSNHAIGFYPRHHRIGTDVTPRPDSRYGVSKVFGEAVGALYADKHGLGVTCIRIGNFGEMPLDHRRLSIWLKPEDLVQLCRIGLDHPDIHFETSDIGRPAGPRISASTRWPSRRNCRRIRSAISTRAAASAAWSSTATGAGSSIGSDVHVIPGCAKRKPGISCNCAS
jgi:uronate dehydrogenase